ncbi:hypothetical protein [Streptomyces sp. NBC_00280]|uniref:hypothetical protein n=1 Tax=Streptomyces sp. NBC_00280 TaxID=2975699 RepID=UPI0032500007
MAILLGASGAASAAGSFSVTGSGPTPQAANASAACGGRYVYDSQGSLVGNPGGIWWTATMWIECI